MVGDGAEVRTKNILQFRFIGETHFGISRGIKMSLAINEPIYKVLRSILHIELKHVLKTYRTWKVLYAKQPTPKPLVESTNNSNVDLW